jgi:hypothetical protein
MVSTKELSSWSRKYPFLEEIIRESEREVFEIEEGEISKVLRCLPKGYHRANNEETRWQWYGIKGQNLKPLMGTSIGDVISKEKFDYVISVDDIDSTNFSDRTISVYPVSEIDGCRRLCRKPILHRMEISDMDHCIREFDKKGLVIAGAKDIAIARINENENNPIHKGSWIGEGIVYIEDNKAMIIDSKYNPRINPKKLPNFEKYANQGYVNNLKIDNESMDKIIRMADEDKSKDPEDRRVLQISKFSDTIPVDNFDSNELTLFLFKDAAKNYGRFLENKNVNKMPYYFPEEYMGIHDSSNESLFGAILGIDYKSVEKNKDNRPFMDMLWISHDNIHWNSKIIKNFRDAGFVSFYGVEDGKKR